MQPTDQDLIYQIQKEDDSGYISDQMRNYQPDERDQFIFTKDKKSYQRLIWGDPIQLTEKDKNHWLAF